MKKILTLIICTLIFASPAQASLLFNNTTGDDLDFGSATAIDDFSEFTFWAWVYPTDLTTNKYIFAKGNVQKRLRVVAFAGAGQVEFQVDRATTDCSRDGAVGTLSSNTWEFVAVVYSESANTCKILNGDLTTPAKEISYTAGSAGSGATVSDAANSFVVGNSSTVGTASFPGRIATVGYVKRALSDGEVRSIQYRPRNVADTYVYAQLGFSGASSIIDWSGKRTTGTGSGLRLSPHVPLFSF